MDVILDFFDYINHKEDADSHFIAREDFPYFAQYYNWNYDKNIPYTHHDSFDTVFQKYGRDLAYFQKNISKHFTANRIIFAQIIFALATITAALGFGHSVSNWCYVLTFVFFF